VVLAASAGEADAEHGRMGGAREPLDLPEGGQSDACLAPGGAGERVPGRQRVIHVVSELDSDKCIRRWVGLSN
jgi:hypothetical protein